MYFSFVQTLTKIILEHGLGDRFISSSQLERLIEGSDKRRFGLVNRAIKSGELIRVKRGLYMLARRHRKHPVHPFALAQALVPGSYISFETALSQHGWLPEKVVTTASVAPGRRSSRYESSDLGVFSFQPLSINRGYHLTLVKRIQIDAQTMLLAEPIRALLDLICLRKTEWQSASWLVEGLRIDLGVLAEQSRSNELETMQGVYKNRRMQRFISALRQELNCD